MIWKMQTMNNPFFKNFDHTSCHSSINFKLEDLDPSTFPENFLCTDKVLSLIASLDISKSTVCDEISAKMLKATAPHIAQSLADLFNKSLTTGKFPTNWKSAKIVPIPKAGDAENPANYRSISILPTLSKTPA